MTTSVYALTASDWAHAFHERGFPLSALEYWLDGLYKDPTLWDRHVAPNSVATLKQQFDFDLPQISKILRSEDGTVKFQMQFKDHLEVETVLIPFPKRFTICLSTQVGCAMNCSFCFTGTQGLKRHLTAGEIVGQYLKAYQWLLQEDEKSLKPSIVFMGQGEPLHNAGEVQKAIEVFNDTKLIGLGRRQMTLSTVGYLPGMAQLKNFPKINLALSLHSPFDHERNQLIPLNQKFPLQDVLNSFDELPHLKTSYMTFEYLMIQDFNMSEEHVEGLFTLISQRKAMINLIPFNPFPGSQWKRPDENQVEEFRKKLVAKKLRVMVRTTKGDDILAACGQLKINQMARNYDR
ncbi:MAG: 23S rRNA (adenine(2503)-C(2))-methyltransferase RlmN [Bdellovibrionales bacterium]|nr:23S rRNA (adenine(2503)-C(2))-methyltransferase RlmN [Bdellovibrionales bacterium]